MVSCFIFTSFFPRFLSNGLRINPPPPQPPQTSMFSFIFQHTYPALTACSSILHLARFAAFPRCAEVRGVSMVSVFFFFSERDTRGFCWSFGCWVAGVSPRPNDGRTEGNSKTDILDFIQKLERKKEQTTVIVSALDPTNDGKHHGRRRQARAGSSLSRYSV